MDRTHHRHAGLVLETVRSPSSAALSSVAASWCRSALHHGLDPEAVHRREFIGQAELDALYEDHRPLLDVANAVLGQIFGAVGRSGCGVFLSDRDGVILQRHVGAGDKVDFDRGGLAQGARWGEADEGTNGIGTCLVEGRPVIIHRDQHFASRNVAISCIDAPVFDPHGRLVAALDVSTCRDDHGPVMIEMIAALVRDAARRIERDYFCCHFEGERIIYLAEDAATGTALLAADRDGLVVGASRAARIRLGLGDADLGEPRPIDQLLGQDIFPSFEDGDRGVLRQALARAGGNVSAAARQLGISRATFYRRMARAKLVG